jgi:hypothetical protein
MKEFYLTAVVTLFIGCSPSPNTKEPEPADNAATRYTNSLMGDRSQAKANVDRMNRAIEKTQKAATEAEPE